MSELFEGVDIVEVDFFELADGGVDITGDRDIDKEQRAEFTDFTNWEKVFGVDDCVRGSGG